MNTAQGAVDCAPAEVGYDASRLDAVNAFFARMIEQNVIHGATYCLARYGKVFASAALGSRHYAKPDIPMAPDTPFSAASITKAFTATAIQNLVEDGLLAIDDPVAKFLPQFDGEPYSGITLHHLLTHSSGLYPESGIADKHHPTWRVFAEQRYEEDGPDTDWIAAGLSGGLRKKPGEEWQYSNFGFQILGAVIHSVTGNRARSFIEERICKPLGMTASGFSLAPEAAERAVVFGKWDEQHLASIIRGKPKDASMWDLMPGTSGGLYTTASDLIRFGNMLLGMGRLGNVRILGRKAVERMTAQHLFDTKDFCWGANSPERRYALGWDMRYITGALPSQEMYFHEGSGASILIVDPLEELAGTWVIPWVGDWSNDCSRRIVNVVWSGLL